MDGCTSVAIALTVWECGLNSASGDAFRVISFAGHPLVRVFTLAVIRIS